MNRLTLVAIVVSLLAALLMSAAAQVTAETADLGTVDVLVLAEGETDGLAQQIQALGGTVNYQYRNLPVVAASIPADQLPAVASFPGVTEIEEDAIIYLGEGRAGGPTDADSTALVVQGLTGDEITPIDPAVLDGDSSAQGWANPWSYTGASQIWPATSGAGSIVAVVDGGVTPNLCLDHAVIGAPGYPNGYNATGDGVPATSDLNYFHGTFIGGVIASSCSLNLSSQPNHPIYLAQAPYLGWPVDYIPIFGQAPAAQIYPVKVFAYNQNSGPESVILDGLDHILTLKKEGLLDIDIVNMSIGGVTFWDGRGAEDRFIEALEEANILFVTSAGNFGPIPNTVGSPATSFSGLPVGALDYAPSSRVFYEYLGLRFMGVSGQGMVMRPTAETRVAVYSSRGPLSDGRMSPQIAALGSSAFYIGPKNELLWADGTSFAAPAVAGAAALLNASWEAQGNETDPTVLANTLLKSADPDEVGEAWRSPNDQGYGALDVAAAFGYLQSGDWSLQPANGRSQLAANVLGEPVKGKVQTWESEGVTVAPGEVFTAVFEINRWTSQVKIDVYDIAAPANPYAYWPNALEVRMQSAKRSSYPHAVERVWYPAYYGDAFEIVIQDGPWTSPWGKEANQPMEPGLMKLSLNAGDWNESPVSFKVRIRRENFRAQPQNRIANGVIKMGDAFLVPANIPEGTNRATFDLVWQRDWSKFPTSRIGMWILDPNKKPVSNAGAGYHAPQRATITAPRAGTWWVLVRGADVNYLPDNYDLYLKLD